MGWRGWNYGDLLDGVARVVPPDSPALIHGERVIPWGEFDRRINRLARALTARGARPGDKVAVYTPNAPAYMEVVAACFKARLVHVNVNYRYRAEEIFYILDNSDAQAVFYNGDFDDLVAEIRPRLPSARTWVRIGTSGAGDGAAEDHEALCNEGDGAPLDVERSPDDLFFIYTGGTTGMPKAVMWRADDLRTAQLQVPTLPYKPVDLDDHVDMVRKLAVRPKQIPACPLMHGTGLLTAISAMISGGCVVTLQSSSFDPHELWRTVTRHKVQQLAIVGDVFGKPMLQALRDKPGVYDPRSVVQIVSSGVMWSEENKRALLEYMPDAVLMDSFGASEGIGFGLAVMTAQGAWKTARFSRGEDVKVFAEDFTEVAPGSGVPGFIARGGPIPVGYYKDPAKSAKTFPEIGGRRWSMPGDWCLLEADGTITLLGRGSQSINSGGEKIYPEEIEEALKTHPDIDDVLVVGVPDERWGQAVTAVVQPRPGVRPDEEALRAHVRTLLAPFKAPKRVVFVEQMFRGPNGKADYKSAAGFARKTLGLE